jgi:hypothetical protein
MVLRNPDSPSDQSVLQGAWHRFCALPRRVRFGLPAAALLVLALIILFTGSSTGRGQTQGAASKVGSPAAGSARPAASPTLLAAINPTSTRPPFVVGEITPIPNRGLTPTPTPSAAQPGEPVKLGDYTVTLLEIRDPATSVYSLVRPTEGNRFAAYQVQITNNSNRFIAYSYLNFRLRDVGGNELRSTASTTLEPALLSGNLAPKETVTGWITFMPREDLATEMLYFQAPGMIGPRGQISVSGPAASSDGSSALSSTTSPGPSPVASAPQTAISYLYVTGGGNAGVSLRAAPGTTAQRLTLLPDGTELEDRLEQRQVDGRSWNLVATAGGDSGWVASEFLTSVPPAPPAAGPLAVASPTPQATVSYLYVTGGGSTGVSLRAAPGTTSQRLTLLPDGTELEDRLEVREVDGRPWNLVAQAGGVQGWIASEFLTGRRPTAPAASPTSVASSGPPSVVSPTPEATVSYVYVTGGGTAGVSLRAAPATTAQRLALLPDGAELEDRLEERQSDGRPWKRVAQPGGVSGWVAAEFLTSTRPTQPVALPLPAN